MLLYVIVTGCYARRWFHFPPFNNPQSLSYHHATTSVYLFLTDSSSANIYIVSCLPLFPSASSGSFLFSLLLPHSPASPKKVYRKMAARIYAIRGGGFFHRCRAPSEGEVAVERGRSREWGGEVEELVVGCSGTELHRTIQQPRELLHNKTANWLCTSPFLFSSSLSLSARSISTPLSWVHLLISLYSFPFLLFQSSYLSLHSFFFLFPSAFYRIVCKWDSYIRYPKCANDLALALEFTSVLPTCDDKFPLIILFRGWPCYGY